MEEGTYTVNKGLAISGPQPESHLPNSPWLGIIYQIPVPGRFGKKNPGISYFFLTVYVDGSFLQPPAGAFRRTFLILFLYSASVIPQNNSCRKYKMYYIHAVLRTHAILQKNGTL